MSWLTAPAIIAAARWPSRRRDHGTIRSATFADLLASAVTEPGIISSAYRQFHNYSIGNQLLAWSQCLARGIQPGPMATFPKLEGTGAVRPQGREGDHALSAGHGQTARPMLTTATSEPSVFTRFVYRPHWFVLAQTDGAEIPPTPIPTWDAGRALAALDVTEVPFDALDGNCLGFARERSIAINPVNPMPHKTRFHELAHVLLGHTAEGMQADGEITPAQPARMRGGSPSRCCAARRWTCPASSTRAATSRLVGRGQPDPGTLGAADPQGGRSDSQGRRRLQRHQEAHSSMRAAIYARVSTLDQEPENQLQELRRYVEARGWTGVEYVTVGSVGREGPAAGPRCSAQGRQAPAVRCAGVLAAGSARAQPAALDDAARRAAGARRGVRQPGRGDRLHDARRASCSCTSWRHSPSSSGNASENGSWRAYSGPGRKGSGSDARGRIRRRLGFLAAVSGPPRESGACQRRPPHAGLARADRRIRSEA